MATVKVTDRSDDWLKRFGQAVRKGLDATALTYTSDVKRSMVESPRGGRVYLRGKRRNIQHKASAPGEPPAPDTGQLVKSILWKRTDGPGPIDAKVDAGSAVLKSLFLEYGTRRMAARPAFRPALARILPQVAVIQGQQLARARIGQ